MEKRMSLFKTGIGIALVRAQGLSSSVSLFTPRQACSNMEKQIYINLCKMKKKELEEIKKSEQRMYDVNIQLLSSLNEYQTKLKKALEPELVRTWIEEIEYKHKDYIKKNMKKLKNEIAKIPKDMQSRELTKRVWVFMLSDLIEKKLQNNDDEHFAELFFIKDYLTESEDPISVEKFAETIANLKIHICDNIHTATFQTFDTLPHEYKLLEEEPFKQIIEILSMAQPGVTRRMLVARLNSSTNLK